MFIRPLGKLFLSNNITNEKINNGYFFFVVLDLILLPTIVNWVLWVRRIIDIILL